MSSNKSQMRSLRVLVACEFSGIVRDAFIARGHKAYSCDLLPSERPGPHRQGDVLDVLGNGWDLMIAHPPCTYLCNSGVRWLTTEPGRLAHMVDGARFFKALLDAPIPLKAIENPIPHRYATDIIGRKYDQIVQPWMFGHPETKATCLWLDGLPPLKPTDNVKAEMLRLPPGERGRIHYMSPGEDRGKLRSLTYQGMADAMAEQWGGHA